MKLRELVKNSTFDINCRIELYVPPEGMAWYDCSPALITYGCESADEIPERMLNANVTYMTTNRETDAVVLEITPNAG